MTHTLDVESRPRVARGTLVVQYNDQRGVCLKGNPCPTGRLTACLLLRHPEEEMALPTSSGARPGSASKSRAQGT